jgi:hypothetical protein
MAKNLTEAIFNSKNNLYENFPEIDGIKYFDLERTHQHYGRIDLDGDAVYVDDSTDNLKPIFSGPSGGDQFAIDFVSAAFRDMRLNVKKMGDANFINNNGYFPTNLIVRKSQSFGDLNFSYDAYINKIYTNFVDKYLSVDRRAEKIKNYRDFVLSFMEYLLPNLKYFPVTKTGYITSIHCSPFISGLMIEIASERHGLGSNSRVLNYVSDDFSNFVFFSKQLKKFGFLMDRNAPWRFVFNIASGMIPYRENSETLTGAQLYMSRFGVNYDNIFPFYFRKAHLEELLNMKNLLFSLYQSFYIQFPTYEEARFTKSNSDRCYGVKYSTERKNRALPGVKDITDDQHDEMILKAILKMRLLETDTPHDKYEFEGFIKELVSNKRLFGVEAALNYINDLTKGFLVTKFNIKGDYWYGKSSMDFEEVQRDSLDNAVDPSLVDYSLTGTKNTQ